MLGCVCLYYLCVRETCPTCIVKTKLIVCLLHVHTSAVFRLTGKTIAAASVTHEASEVRVLRDCGHGIDTTTTAVAAVAAS